MSGCSLEKEHACSCPLPALQQGLWTLRAGLWGGGPGCTSHRLQVHLVRSGLVYSGWVYSNLACTGLVHGGLACSGTASRQAGHPGLHSGVSAGIGTAPGRLRFLQLSLEKSVFSLA